MIVTTTSNSEEPRDFADNYLRDAVGNDQNGSVLLLDMGQREIYISTSGNMIDYLTDSRIDSILDDVYDQMTMPITMLQKLTCLNQQHMWKTEFQEDIIV